MRISKEPEVRKQEIIDVAMRVFAEKGYEATTRKDSAGAAGVVAGLCYHYFPGKQQLYDIAVRQYAKECSCGFVEILSHREQTLEQCLDALARACIQQQEGYRYKDFFDKRGNELFHKQLAVINEEAVPLEKRLAFVQSMIK